MFTGIDIKLTGPICTCAKQDLIWGIIRDDYGLYVQCGQCNTKLVVPHDKFVAEFKLNAPYSGGVKEKSTPLAKVLKFVKGGVKD